jgi:hypothetical protein
MFHKLSFTELANLYGAVADLEKHYGHETVHEALKEMADRLDQSEKNVVQIEANTIAKMWSPMMLAELKRPTLLDVFPPGETIKIKDEESGINTEATVGPKSTEQQLELLPKPRKPHKVRQTQERVRGEDRERIDL